jgi:hypothetical protein
MHPGGSVGAIVSRSYLDEHGWPKVQGVDWAPFFSPRYYKKEIPVWTTYDPTGMLGEAGARAPDWPRAVLLGFLVGTLLGLGLVLGRRAFRRRS